MRIRVPWTILLLAAAVPAQDKPQIDWVGDWDAAFKQARDENRPVMLCINSKDEEQANHRAAFETYRDPEFVALSRKFVMIVVSTRVHAAHGVCSRFGRVTCQQHLDCWKGLRAAYGEQFVSAAAKGEMISPQHAWFRPDGTLLRRKEYELTKAELMQRMRRVLAEVSGEELPPEEGAADPGGKAEPEPEPGAVAEADAPLSEKDLAELARVRDGDAEARAAALANLLATGKTAARVAVTDLLAEARKTEVKCALLRAIGRARLLDARIAIEEMLKDRDALVRSFAAVALEDLGSVDSVVALLKRTGEKDTMARKNVYRALGTCGGAGAEPKAAKALLKAITSDKQNSNKKHAALALRSYGGEGRKLVVPKLEQLAAKTNDGQVRGGLVFTLAHIGSKETTLPVFQRILDKSNVDYVQNFMKTAIRFLKNGSGDWGRSTWFLFAEDRDDPARQD